VFFLFSVFISLFDCLNLSSFPLLVLLYRLSSFSFSSLALLRQTDPNWEAFFFITDNNPFEKRLQQILRKHSDPRITYFDVPMRFRPKVRLKYSCYGEKNVFRKAFFIFLFFLFISFFLSFFSILLRMPVILPQTLS
jgi:hypothetical protein